MRTCPLCKGTRKMGIRFSEGLETKSANQQKTDALGASLLSHFHTFTHFTHFQLYKLYTLYKLYKLSHYHGTTD